MSDYDMDWALVCATGGPGPWPRPLVRLSWAYWMAGGLSFC